MRNIHPAVFPTAWCNRIWCISNEDSRAQARWHPCSITPFLMSPLQLSQDPSSAVEPGPANGRNIFFLRRTTGTSNLPASPQKVFPSESFPSDPPYPDYRCNRSWASGTATCLRDLPFYSDFLSCQPSICCVNPVPQAKTIPPAERPFCSGLPQSVKIAVLADRHVGRIDGK